MYAYWTELLIAENLHQANLLLQKYFTFANAVMLSTIEKISPVSYVIRIGVKFPARLMFLQIMKFNFLGLNKFSKRLRNPHYVENNEITDFLSRCPTNQQLDEWRELSSHTPKSRGKAYRKGKVKHNTSDHKLKKRSK